MESVCAAINARASEVYTKHSMHFVPLTVDNVRADVGMGRRARAHSDARTISAVILRKHTLVDVGFGEMKSPTIAQIRTAIGLSHIENGSGGMTMRMVTLCELMRKVPTYREIYVSAVRDLKARAFELCDLRNIENAVPCE